MADVGGYRILAVCTGNVCRSPFLERVLRAAFDRLAVETGRAEWASGIDVASAGTNALIGSPMTVEMLALAEAYRIPATPHVARQLEPAHLTDADLVLALARAHRAAVARTLPTASRRAFTLLEFARLLEDAADSGATIGAGPVRATMTALVDAAAMRRGLAIAPDDPADDDIEDPYGRDDATYRRSSAAILDAARRIMTSIERLTGTEVAR